MSDRERNGYEARRRSPDRRDRDRGGRGGGSDRRDR